MESKRNTKQILRTGMSAVLVSAIVAGSGIPAPLGGNMLTAEAAWDGYEEGNGQREIELLDFNNISAIISAGVKPSRKYAASGKAYSAYWGDHTVNGDFWIKSFAKSIPSDWTNYTKVTLDIYSEKATGAEIMAIVYNPNAADGISYISSRFKVDWEGRKKVELKLSDMSSTRGASTKNATQFRLVSNGNWSIVGHPETELYISSVKVGGYTTGMDFVNDFYDSEVVEGAFAALKDSVGVYAGGINAVNDEGAHPITYSIELKDDTVMVPAQLFADYLGAKVTDDGKNYSINLGGVTLSGAADSAAAGDSTLSVAAYAKDGMCYVPGEEIAKLLGLCAFTDNGFLVMGTEEAYNVLRRPGSLGVNEYNEVIAYNAYANPIDAASFSAEDCKPVKDNWRRYLVGDETINDMSDPNIAAKIKSLDNNARLAWEQLIKGNPEDEIFTGIQSVDSGDMTTAYNKVWYMAKAYATYGSEYYHNEELFADIIYALDWLYDHRYSLEAKKNWTITGFDNWHDWDIGSPEALIHCLLCLEDKIPASEITRYLSYFDYRRPLPKSTAANYCHMSELIIGSAMLQNDYKKALTILTALQKEYLYVDDNERTVESQLQPRDFPVQIKGAGFFTDGSYVFHTLHAMNSTYGPKHYSSLMQIEKILNGTAFDIPFVMKNNLPDFYFNTFYSIVYGTTVFRSVLGRGTNPNNATSGNTHLVNAFTLAEIVEDEELKNELYGIVKAVYTTATDQVKNSLINSMPFDAMKKFKEVIEDEAIKPAEPRTMSKMFYNMDKSVHMRPDWAAGVSMSSTRIFNYESINEENLDGWYLGDGRTEYYLSGSNMNGTSQYWSSMDKYRMPGTTVDTQERQALSIDQGNEYLSTKDFVGGVTLGAYGASVMELESYHNDEPFGKKTAHGNQNPAHTSDLTAKKSYYMTDEGIICLGSSVNAKNNNNAEVLTIVDNPLANTTKIVSDQTTTPYEIANAVANQTPEAENIAMNTLDGSFNTKWAGEDGGEIVWDLGEVKTLGFANISLLNGSKRQQYLTLQVSSDGSSWETVFDGASSGKKEMEEAFDLKGKSARYVKYINKGNSNATSWVSITECKIYPPNADGTIGTKEAEIYGDDKITVDGKVIDLLGEDTVLTGSEWVNFDDKVGYWFPENASVNSGELKARWTKNAQSHFELWFSHGVNPTEGGYAYMILPGKTSGETAAFASSGNVEILVNNADIQAAKDNTTGITYITFWKAGSLGGITVDKPCMVIAKESGSSYELAVSDPTQKLTALNISINKELKTVSADEDGTVTAANGTTKIALDITTPSGRSIEFSFNK
ncbi:MAG: discoidin domain-containing protein [Clostridia bacterium]|nr:discoidin domain-containing protein [Clostridia bacterium]